MKNYITKLLSIVMLSFLCLPAIAQVDFREETIYFVMTTRFFDGDPSNNRPNEWSSYHPDPEVNPLITDPNDVTWKGDFKGLIEKLDYIQDLGFTAIWITPIVQNWSPLDYHGYHAYDFTKVDPRLESEGATFQDLIDAVHARGMKIVLDIVTNHAGRFGIKGLAEIKYNTDPTEDWGQDAEGNVLQPNPNWEYDGMTPNPADGKIWSRANIPTMPAPYNEDLSQHNWPSTAAYVGTTDPEWYHHSGNGFAQGWDDTENLYNRALAGDTPDLNTSSQVVRDYLIAAYTTFINMGVDGFRWDTIKHMSKEDVLAFLDAFKAVNPDLFVFGEVAQKRHELHQEESINPHWYTWRGATNNSEPSGMAVIDFYAQASFHNPFEYGGGFSEVKAAARYDHLYADPSTNLLWLDNHDFGPNNDWNKRYGGTDENLAACMNFMFTWRGIPIVYYGTEMRFKAGTFADIHDAQGTKESINETGRAYYGDAMDEAPSHKIYQHIKKLNAIRSAVPALQKGSWEWNGGDMGNGVGFVRRHEGSEVAVGLAKDGSATFTFTGLTNGVYRDAVTGAEAMVSGGTLTATVASGSAAIYVLNGPGMIGANGVGFFQPGIGGPTKPMVTFTPDNERSENDITVTLSAALGSGGPYQIYYTINGSTPSTSSTQYSGGFTISESTTIKAIAIDNSGNISDVITKNYSIGPIVGQTIYFKKPSNWSQVNVHHWNATPANAIANSNWPGDMMTKVNDTEWYTITFEAVDGTDLLFNDNGGLKTDDLNRIGNGWFDGTSWSATCPGDCPGGEPENQAPVISINPASGNYPDGVTVMISSSDPDGDALTVYYTTDGSTPTTTSSIWSAGSRIERASGELTIKAIAVDDKGLSSDVATGTYTFNQVQGMTLCYKAPSGCADPKIYFWAVEGGTATTTWPGESMTSMGNGIYCYTIPNATCANIIFSCGGGNKTADLTRCGDGTYDNGWVGSDTQAPSISVDPAGMNFSGSLDITLSASDNEDTTPTIYYTLDGSAPGPGSMEATNNTNINISATTELRAIAKDATGNTSIEINEIYTLQTTGTGMKVYFKPDASWNTNNIRIHHWNASPIGSQTSSAWPGVLMTTEANGWYSFTFNSTVNSSNLLFHDQTNQQTADLNRNGTGWYKDGNWYNTEPTGETTGMTITLTAPSNWNQPTIYFWNMSSGTTTTWPGEEMTSIGNNRFEYTFTNDNCGNFIFTDNGANQTGDLTQCGSAEYLYNSNTWISASNSRIQTTDQAPVTAAFEAKVYPNPIMDQLNINLSMIASNEVNISIYNVQGLEMVKINKQLATGTHKVAINALDLRAGIYLYKISSNGTQVVGRFIKK